MIRIRDIALPYYVPQEKLKTEAARLLKIDKSKISEFKIVKKSIDARKKPDIKYIYTIDVSVTSNEKTVLKNSGCKKATIATNFNYKIPKIQNVQNRPVIIGFGPAGMFAALVLAKAGLKPIVIERGSDAKTRYTKVQHFFKTGKLDTSSNIQFGEGGAGTFSDGKLNTGINNPRIHWVLEQFVKAGANEEILYNAKPHIGTDILLEVVQNLRKTIISLGGEVYFDKCVIDIITDNGKISKLKLNDQSEIECLDVILAIGHSARDTFLMLHDKNVPMEPKAFAMGVRIEHKQSDINFSQFGTDNALLPAADYKLVSHLDEKTVYTFCMCPGGYVVAAASENGGVVTNGMSYADRSGENANSALLVTLNPKDFPDNSVLGGMKWQQQIEQSAFIAGGENYKAPAQCVGDFLSGVKSSHEKSVTPTYRPGVTWCDLHDVLPPKITSALEKGITEFAKKLKGFDNPDAVMTAPETRSSSPIRILRGEDRQSDIKGLYPTGEGAGYAGGIMSAAIDGILTAEAIIDKYKI